MSAKKMDRSAHEPGWGEVILGAVLSIALGAVLGVFSLVMKPPVLINAKGEPKERVAGTIYYEEGSRDSAKARQAPAKRKAFAQGTSILVTEDEINSFGAAPASATPPPAAKKKADEKAPATKAPTPPAPAPAGSTDTIALGNPNIRIRDGAVQLAVPVTVNALDLGLRLTVLATGTFEKKGEAFAFAPATLTVGSCPVHRLPFALGFVTKQFLSAKGVPDDVATPWGRLAGVAVEGNALKLTMP
jgi:hypothetical protein